jgi:salicylate hydroxylase
MAQVPLRIAVVGGGIGGLFAANALLVHGHSVVVYEQAAALGEVGAGVLITPNSVRQLQRVGLGPAVDEWGARIGPGSRYLRWDGTPIAEVQTTDSAGWNAVFGFHRADLVRLLSARLPVGAVRTGCRCTGFEQVGDTARVCFGDGTVTEADVVVAADGIHSTLQHQVVPPSQPVASGTVAYRGLLPHDLVPDWPTADWLMWLGPGRHFLAYPVRAGRLVCYAGFVPTDEQMQESWSASGDPDTLRREFAGWDPRIGRLLGHVRTTHRWGLYDRRPLSSWTRGRLALLGDAAHPMLPHVGQGANQSIEDGAALATLLAGADRESVPALLQRYESLRRERVAAVQRRARESGLRYDSSEEDLSGRDDAIRAHRAFRRWVYDYDVVLEAEAATASDA